MWRIRALEILLAVALCLAILAFALEILEVLP